MANIQGQIQVGASHQARLPALQLDVPASVCESREELVWRPNSIADVDLLMYLRAARSMAAFVGWCDGGSTDDGCAAASMDETTINSLQLLHDNVYDVGRALQALVKVINPKSADRRWSDEDAKRFVKGLKQHGKNFFKIRRDLLPAKSTSQLVEYYYLWKKSATASTTRPHRQHRRPTLRRQAPTPTPPSSESVEEPSSPSDGSDNEMESDESSERLAASAAAADTFCVRCKSTKSRSWFEDGDSKSGCVLCASCYASGPANGETPPFMFRPVKEEDQTVDNDQQVESGSSVDGGAEMSDEGTGGSVERVTPCSNVTRTSSDGAVASDKESRGSVKASPVPLKTEVELSDATSLHGLSGVPVIANVPSSKADLSEDWKMEEDWKGWKQEHSEPAETALLAPSIDSRGSSSAALKDDSVAVVAKGEVYDMRPVKVEQVVDYSISRSSASSSDSRSGRVVVSIAPCTTQHQNRPHSPPSVLPLPSQPPPLLHSTSRNQPSPSPLQTSVIQSAVIIADTSARMQIDSDDSEQEMRTRSPSPEPRLVNEECHRSTNAIFVRHWFRGRTTCARCDIEYRPAPHSSLTEKRDGARPKISTIKHTSAAQQLPASKDVRRPESRPEEKKKSHTPPESRGLDAQITSTLLGYGGDLAAAVPPRGPGYPLPTHHPTPALQKLSEYIRPRAPGVAEPPRFMPYGQSGPSMAPPPQGLDAYLRMPGAYFPPAIWEAMERERDSKEKRDAWERDMDKMRHILAAQEFERLAAMGPSLNPEGPYLEELQRISLALGALPPGMAAIPNVFCPPNMGIDLVQRERERLDALRSSQEQQQQQQQLAAALAASENRENAAAVYQLFQKYSQDPAMLQRHLMALASPKEQELARMVDASSLIYHFARADPLAAAAAASASPAAAAAMPPGLQQHFVAPGQEHQLVAAAQNYERMCADMLSRPPYSTDPILAQQLMMQMSAQHDAIRHQLAMERDGLTVPGPPPPGRR